MKSLCFAVWLCALIPLVALAKREAPPPVEQIGLVLFHTEHVAAHERGLTIFGNREWFEPRPELKLGEKSGLALQEEMANLGYRVALTPTPVGTWFDFKSRLKFGIKIAEIKRWVEGSLASFGEADFILVAYSSWREADSPYMLWSGAELAVSGVFGNTTEKSIVAKNRISIIAYDTRSKKCKNFSLDLDGMVALSYNRWAETWEALPKEVVEEIQQALVLAVNGGARKRLPRWRQILTEGVR